MYQDKIKNEAEKTVVSGLKSIAGKNIFELSGLKPLAFEPDEWVSDATFVARDILSKRSNKEISKLAVAVTSILHIGENLLHELAVKMLGGANDRKSVSLSEGRALYLLCDYFDLKTIALKNVQWSELFATLTLMQSATIIFERSQVYGEDMLSQSIKASLPRVVSDLRTEIVDSVTRAECLYDKSFKEAKLGGRGGTAKAKLMEPLKVKVVKVFIADYSGRSVRHAGKLIQEKLEKENCELLKLSRADELNVQFSKWIGEFKRGEWKMPLER